MDKNETPQDLAMSDWRASNPEISQASYSASPTTNSTNINNNNVYSFKSILISLVAAFAVLVVVWIPFLIVYLAITGNYGIDNPSSGNKNPVLSNALGIIGWIVSLALAYRQFRISLNNNANK